MYDYICYSTRTILHWSNQSMLRVKLASPNGVVIRPNPGLEQLGLGAPYGEQPALNASPGPLSANALQLRDSVERLEMQLLGSVGGAVGTFTFEYFPCHQ